MCFFTRINADSVQSETNYKAKLRLLNVVLVETVCCYSVFKIKPHQILM